MKNNHACGKFYFGLTDIFTLMEILVLREVTEECEKNLRSSFRKATNKRI